LQKDIAEQNTKTGDFVEVPHGDYEVKVVKIELGQSKKELPMAKVWFEILAGEYKGQKIFMNQMLTSAFGFHKMNEFLNSLETGIPVLFENFQQYADLFTQVFEEVDGKAEYQLAYTANPKNDKFSDYNIVQRF
jgi:hypothetical protein